MKMPTLALSRNREKSETPVLKGLNDTRSKRLRCASETTFRNSAVQRFAVQQLGVSYKHFCWPER